MINKTAILLLLLFIFFGLNTVDAQLDSSKTKTVAESMFSPGFKDFFDVLRNVFTVLAILIGGGWTLWRFKTFRERHAKMEFTVNYKYVDKLDAFHIIEFSAELSNKGLASQKVHNFYLEVFAFEPSKTHDANVGEVQFKERLFKDNWIKETLWIDGGTNQKFTYPALVPVGKEYLLLRSRFYFSKIKTSQEDNQEFMEAKVAFSVMQSKAAPASQ